MPFPVDFSYQRLPRLDCLLQSVFPAIEFHVHRTCCPWCLLTAAEDLWWGKPSGRLERLGSSLNTTGSRGRGSGGARRAGEWRNSQAESPEAGWGGPGRTAIRERAQQYQVWGIFAQLIQQSFHENWTKWAKVRCENWDFGSLAMPECS